MGYTRNKHIERLWFLLVVLAVYFSISETRSSRRLKDKELSSREQLYSDYERAPKQSLGNVERSDLVKPGKHHDEEDTTEKANSRSVSVEQQNFKQARQSYAENSEGIEDDLIEKSFTEERTESRSTDVRERHKAETEVDPNFYDFTEDETESRSASKTDSHSSEMEVGRNFKGTTEERTESRSEHKSGSFESDLETVGDDYKPYRDENGRKSNSDDSSMSDVSEAENDKYYHSQSDKISASGSDFHTGPTDVSKAENDEYYHSQSDKISASGSDFHTGPTDVSKAENDEYYHSQSDKISASWSDFHTGPTDVSKAENDEYYHSQSDKISARGSDFHTGQSRWGNSDTGSIDTRRAQEQEHYKSERGSESKWKYEISDSIAYTRNEDEIHQDPNSGEYLETRSQDNSKIKSTLHHVDTSEELSRTQSESRQSRSGNSRRHKEYSGYASSKVEEISETDTNKINEVQTDTTLTYSESTYRESQLSSTPAIASSETSYPVSVYSTEEENARAVVELTSTDYIGGRGKDIKEDLEEMKTTPEQEVVGSVDERVESVIEIKPPFTGARQCRTRTPPCCVAGKVEVNLGTFQRKARVKGEIEGVVTKMSDTRNKFNRCSDGAEIKVTFEPMGNEGCFGCTSGPFCGRRMLQLDLDLSHSKRRNVLFEITDDPEGDGAIVYAIFPHIIISPRNSGSNGTKRIDIHGAENAYTSKLTLYIGNQYIRVTNDKRLDEYFCHSDLFHLNGQFDPESGGMTSNTITIGINRAISSNQTGFGVCTSTLKWACPWPEY